MCQKWIAHVQNNEIGRIKGLQLSKKIEINVDDGESA